MNKSVNNNNDSKTDLFLLFIDEERNKETEKRFSPYLKECDNYNEKDRPKTYDISHKEVNGELSTNDQ